MVTWKLNMAQGYISDFEVSKLQVLIPPRPYGQLMQQISGKKVWVNDGPL